MYWSPAQDCQSTRVHREHPTRVRRKNVPQKCLAQDRRGLHKSGLCLRKNVCPTKESTRMSRKRGAQESARSSVQACHTIWDIQIVYSGLSPSSICVCLVCYVFVFSPWSQWLFNEMCCTLWLSNSFASLSPYTIFRFSVAVCIFELLS